MTLAGLDVHPVARRPGNKRLTNNERLRKRVDRMWQNPNHIPAVQGPVVSVSAVRRRVV
jgi:hypothetical protein